MDFKGGKKQTSDVFIINDYVYWRYIKTTFTTKPGMLIQTDSDEFFQVDYKNKPHYKFISSKEFYEAKEIFENVKDVPEYYDALIEDVLKYKWLATVLYTSTIMVFDQ